MRDYSKLYGVNLVATVCPNCDRAFLVQPETASHPCPHCLNVSLEPITDTDRLPPTPAPELVVPFNVSAAQLDQQVQGFAKSFYFTPPDLTTENLRARLTKQYLPVWLVDCDIVTRWQAEVGFDYEVVSHSEAYSGGRWQTTEKRKVRINWEPRVGELSRHYDNLRAPALEEHATLVHPLGKFKIWDAEVYNSAEHASAAIFRLPNRQSADAWTDVVPQALQRCEKDCMAAASGQHIRQFHWDPAYSEHHWTSMLLPVFTTYYLDDEQNQIPLLIHGRTAKMIGRKVGSMQLARRTSMIMGAVALFLLLLITIAYVGGFGESTLLLMCPMIFLVLAALGPLVYVSNLNSKTE